MTSSKQQETKYQLYWARGNATLPFYRKPYDRTIKKIADLSVLAFRLTIPWILAAIVVVLATVGFHVYEAVTVEGWLQSFSWAHFYEDTVPAMGSWTLMLGVGFAVLIGLFILTD